MSLVKYTSIRRVRPHQIKAYGDAAARETERRAAAQHESRSGNFHEAARHTAEADKQKRIRRAVGRSGAPTSVGMAQREPHAKMRKNANLN
jgi:hypothetical protein